MKNKIIITFLSIFLFSGLISVNASDIHSENNLYCSNELKNTTVKYVSYSLQTKITKVMNIVKRKTKYTDEKLLKLNKKILTMAEKPKVKNNKKKYNLFLYLVTEIDDILKNKNILTDDYLKNECILAQKLGNKNINLDFSKNTNIISNKENIDTKNTSIIKKTEEKVKSSNKNNNVVKKTKKQKKIDPYNYTEGTVTIKNGYYIDTKLSETIKNHPVKYQMFEKVNIKEELFDDSIINKNNDVDFVSDKKEQIINGVKYIMEENPLEKEYNKKDLIDDVKSNFIIKTKDGLIVEYKNKQTLGLLEKYNSINGPKGVRITATLYGDGIYNIVNKLINQTNIYKKYQLRPIITNNFIKKVNGINYIKNSKGNYEPIDYYYFIDKGNYNINKYDIRLNHKIGGKKVEILNTYRMWDFYNNSSLSEKKEILKNIYQVDLNGRYDLGIYKFYLKPRERKIFAPNDIKYNVGLSKKEYEQLESYNKQLKNLNKKLNSVKFKLKNTGYIDTSNINKLMHNVGNISNTAQNQENLKKEQQNLESESLILKQAKLKLYLKWFDRKNVCMYHGDYFDKTNLTRIYPNLSKEFDVEVEGDRIKTLKTFNKWDYVICKI